MSTASISSVGIYAATSEEQLYSDTIHKNLYVLMNFAQTEPSDVLRRVVVPNLFIKPNTKTFQHVIHFLLNLLDSPEFKKHVHWPCYVKQDETQFRLEVLAYMNLLNEKHKLGLEAMKMKVVVFPGGVNFMKIMLKISNFVMSELVRRANATDMHAIDVDLQITEFTAWKEDVLQRIEELDSKSRELDCRTDQRKLTLKALSEKTGHVIDNELLDSFEALIESFKTKSLVPGLQCLSDIDQNCNNLAQIVISFKENSCRTRINLNKDEILLWQSKFFAIAPISLHPQIENVIQNGRIHRKNLCTVFEFIVPFVLSIAQSFRFRDVTELKKEAEMVGRLLSQTKVLQLKITKVERKINEGIASVNELFQCSPPQRTIQATKRLKQNILFTPVMSTYLGTDRGGPENQANRLPLFALDLNRSQTSALENTHIPPKTTPSRICMLNTIRKLRGSHNKSVSTAKYTSDERMNTSKNVVCMTKVPFLQYETTPNVPSCLMQSNASPSGRLVYTNHYESPKCRSNWKDDAKTQFTANETQKSASASDDENIIGNIVKRIVFSPNPAYRATDDILLKMEEGETLFDISDTVLNDISS